MGGGSLNLEFRGGEGDSSRFGNSGGSGGGGGCKNPCLPSWGVDFFWNNQIMNNTFLLFYSPKPRSQV